MSRGLGGGGVATVSVAVGATAVPGGVASPPRTNIQMTTAAAAMTTASPARRAVSDDVGGAGTLEATPLRVLVATGAPSGRRLLFGGSVGVSFRAGWADATGRRRRARPHGRGRWGDDDFGIAASLGTGGRDGSASAHPGRAVRASAQAEAEGLEVPGRWAPWDRTA